MKTPRLILAPSILTADFSNLAPGIQSTESGGADWLYMDVMDGNYVPNLTFGPKLVADVSKQSSLFLDVHLMVLHAEDYFQELADAGVGGVTIHHEANVHLDVAIQKIKKLGMRVGVALNPATSVDVLEPLLAELDLVLVMTVNPGFGGQKLIPYCVDKITKLRKIAEKIKPELDIQVDGGWKQENVNEAINAGANVIVAGSAIFNRGDIESATRDFKEAMLKTQ